MKKFFCILAILCFCLPSVANTQAPFVPVAGKAYKVLTTKAKAPTDKVQVTEFFSYGCPACAHFEPTLEKWLSHKPSNVQFERIPVTFEDGWMPLAAAYYTAKRLNIAEKISPLMFKAIWQDRESLNNESALQNFFVKHGGVSAQQFKDVYDFAPQMAAQVFHGQSLMNAYKVDEIPTLIVNGQYKTSVSMTGSSANTITTLNFLIDKVAKKVALTQPKQD